ncbi:hypothetical protein FJR11_07610 [Anabaena sp. UHCC 0187]|nr:hypothetical protein [Anabaena sp. UHCC 0187]
MFNPGDFEDEYAQSLDNLAISLQHSYEHIKEIDKLTGKFDYSSTIANRLRAFYCYQLKLKEFLGKQVAQAGSDFFVETIIFFLKLFNDLEHLDLEIASERPIQRKRNAIRPDISIWRGNELLAVIECKTQLGWLRENWPVHFQEREQKLREVFPNVEIFLVVMTSCNWSGFGNDPRVGKRLFCLLNNVWPTDCVNLHTPIELLFNQVKEITCRELEEEVIWDKAFAKSHDVLAQLAAAALAEDDAGKTLELDPEIL